MTTRAVGYIRVSLEKMAEQGVSLDAQRAKLDGYAQLYELELVDVVVEAESAKSLERPGLARALGMLTAGAADAILVVKLDRLTRSVADLGHLIEEYFAPGKWALLSVGEQIDTRSAGGRLVLNVLASVSQWERESTGERTSAAMQHMRSRGEYTGGQPRYGFRLAASSDADETVRLEPEPAEQLVLAEAKDLHRRGLPLRQIARALELNGKMSRTGTPFAASAIRKMVVADEP